MQPAFDFAAHDIALGERDPPVGAEVIDGVDLALGVSEFAGAADASQRVLALCNPIAHGLPRDMDALYHAAFNAAGEACDAAAAAGTWAAPHLMRAAFDGADPLDLGALPAPLPPEPAHRVDAALVAADGRANAWAMYEHAAQLVHSGAMPLHGEALGRTMLAQLARIDFFAARWVRADRAAARAAAAHCVVLHPSGPWVVDRSDVPGGQDQSDVQGG